MQLGLIGLGRMGGNMGHRLLKSGHHALCTIDRQTRWQSW